MKPLLVAALALCFAGQAQAQLGQSTTPDRTGIPSLDAAMGACWKHMRLKADGSYAYSDGWDICREIVARQQFMLRRGKEDQERHDEDAVVQELGLGQ